MHNGKICVKCQVELRPKKNGIDAVEMGTAGPLTVTCADLWYCPSCGYELIIGFAKKPFSQHFEEGFKEPPDSIRFWLNEREKQMYQQQEN